jgi:hypothetical protein
MEDELLFSDNDSMTRIVASLIPRDNIGVFPEEIGRSALAFISPLGAQYDRISHNLYPQNRLNPNL